MASYAHFLWDADDEDGEEEGQEKGEEQASASQISLLQGIVATPPANVIAA